MGGCYWYCNDNWLLLLDLNFIGFGCTFIDVMGVFCFMTIKFGVYLWGNYYNVWCFVYIYFSLFGCVFM